MLYFLGISCAVTALTILYIAAAVAEGGPIDPACLAQTLITAALFGLMAVALIAVGDVSERLDMLIDAITNAGRRRRT